MNMFDKYDNLSPDYIPDNSSLKVLQNKLLFRDKLSQPMYNAKNEFIGYRINEGNTVKLNTGLRCNIKVEEDALIYNTPDARPDDTTIGMLGQKAYNTVDAKSFTCVKIVGNIQGAKEYQWEEDSVFTMPSKGTQEVVFMPYARYNTAELKILNFRYELIYNQDILVTEQTVTLDNSIVNQLKQGVYIVEVYVSLADEKRLVTKYKLMIHNDISYTITICK